MRLSPHTWVKITLVRSMKLKALPFVPFRPLAQNNEEKHEKPMLLLHVPKQEPRESPRPLFRFPVFEKETAASPIPIRASKDGRACVASEGRSPKRAPITQRFSSQKEDTRASDVCAKLKPVKSHLEDSHRTRSR